MYKIVADRGGPISQNALAYRWAEQNKNLEEAERLIKLVLKNNHQHLYDSNYMDTYGFVLYKQGKYEEAIKQFEKAMGISPDNATIHNHLGDCYVKINKTDKAKEQYLKALELKPMTPDDKLNDQIRAKLDALEQAPADPLN